MITFRGLTRLPINCRACPCHNEVYDECNAIRIIDYEANNDCIEGKPDACPLVEIRLRELRIAGGELSVVEEVSDEQ